MIKNLSIILFFAYGLFVLGSCGEETPPDPMVEAIPKMSIKDAQIIEGESQTVVMSFELSLTSSYSKNINVNYSTTDVSATSGKDYEGVQGILTIPAGQLTSTIAVDILADTEEEQDEQFLLKLSDPVNATISRGDAVGTIQNYKVIIDNPGDGYETPLEYPDYTLLWNDEFTGDAINSDFYTHELGDHGWGNEELQNYTASTTNSFIDEGKLVIEAKQEGNNYTSARIITRDKFEFTFGRVDIRVKVPTSQGIWPALWMLGGDFNEIGWPACGEIDIMELVGFEPNKIHGTAHYGPQGQSFSNNKGGSKTLAAGEVYSDKFHVFSIIWEKDRIEWYMDDEKFYTLTKNAVGSDIWRFNHEFFLILNVAVGGKWPGPPDATTTFPQQMVIDYIRVFQK